MLLFIKMFSDKINYYSVLKGVKMEPFIEIRNLKKFLRMGQEKVYALNGVDLDIYKNEVLAYWELQEAENLLLNMIAGLEKPTKGEIVIGDFM